MTAGYETPVSFPIVRQEDRRPLASFRWQRRAGGPFLQQAVEVVEFEGSIAIRSFQEWIDVPVVDDEAGQAFTHHEPGEFGEGATVRVTAAAAPAVGGDHG